MTKEEARNLMMDYLFDEMDAEQKQDFENIVNKRPELLEELNELRQTREQLKFLPEPEPSKKRIVLLPEPIHSKPDTPEKKARIFLHPAVMTVIAAAASLLVILFASYLTGLQAGQTEAGFYLTFGNTPVQTEEEGGISEADVYELMEQVQNENILLLTGLMEQVQQQQNDQLREVLDVLTEYYDQRRRQDLILIADGLNQLESETNYRFSQTDEALGSIIYALSSP
jgi:hypothetical protein